MTDSSKLLIEQTSSGVVMLTINRPQARNALDWDTQNLFLDIIQKLVSDASVRILILTGAGDRAFCAGGDLVELAHHNGKSDGERLTSIMGEALDLLENTPFPSIAAINGHALGGGAEIALACDLRIMSETAKFGLVQLSLGLTPGWGAGQRLLHLVGYSRAMELLLRAESITAADMHTLGLVNTIVPAEKVLPHARSLAEHIAGWDGDAVAAVKRVLRGGLRLPYDEARQAEKAEFPKLWASEAHIQAVNDFLKTKRQK